MGKEVSIEPVKNGYILTVREVWGYERYVAPDLVFALKELAWHLDLDESKNVEIKNKEPNERE